jgi:hypothetical protein
MAFSWLDPTTWPTMAPNALTQSILPGWSFFTVNETNSTDPATEQRVVAGNSYGRQIGRMMDVLQVLIERDASLAETKAGKAFEDLRKAVDKAKDDARADRLKKLMADLKDLKETDPQAFKDLIDGV